MAIAGALSLAFHAALLAGLWLDRPPPPPPPPPVFELTLVRPEPSIDELPAPAPAQDQPAPATAPSPPASDFVRRDREVPRGVAVPPGVLQPPSEAHAPSPTPQPAPAAAPPAGPRLSDVLRADACLDLQRLSPSERDRCYERLGGGRAAGPVPPTARLRRALEAADDARAKANRPLGERFDDPLTAQCAGSGLCHRELKGIPFGRVPEALPVIPPSTLRGDDDALRPKPRP